MIRAILVWHHYDVIGRKLKHHTTTWFEGNADQLERAAAPPSSSDPMVSVILHQIVILPEQAGKAI